MYSIVFLTVLKIIDVTFGNLNILPSTHVHITKSYSCDCIQDEIVFTKVV